MKKIKALQMNNTKIIIKHNKREIKYKDNPYIFYIYLFIFMIAYRKKFVKSALKKKKKLKTIE